MMGTFSWSFPYPSKRMPVLADNVVATSQPLAAQAGLRMLLNGGNAVDAAVAAAITLVVVEPTGNGLGSDAFAFVWDGQTLSGYNGSGRSPKRLTLDRFSGRNAMPLRGWDTVTVPGAVETWLALSQRWGRLPFARLFEPAIAYATDGFTVSPVIASQWAEAAKELASFETFAETFLVKGRPPSAGDRFVCPALAASLEEIACTGTSTFYTGRLAEKIVAHAENTGGLLTMDDLAEHHGQWVDPIFIPYRGIHLNEIPPNGQGLAALMALGILAQLDLIRYPVDSADSIHLQIEAMKTAFAEAHSHIADPAHMRIAHKDFLSESFLSDLARTIRMDCAGQPRSRLPEDHGTVYLSAADASGMMVSYIQSNFQGFGSGIVVPGTGISLQNRGYGFRLDEQHPNCVDGGKRPYHTIIPGFVTNDTGGPLMSFGVMGGHMQPQGHVQMMVRIFEYGQNPQAACDAPRWHVTEDFHVVLEPGIGAAVQEDLKQRGHIIKNSKTAKLFGGAQLVYRTDHGYVAASDLRKDGQAVGY